MREKLNETVWQLGQNTAGAAAVLGQLEKLARILAGHGIRLCPILDERGGAYKHPAGGSGLEGWLNDPRIPAVLYTDCGEKIGLGNHLPVLERQLTGICGVFGGLSAAGWEHLTAGGGKSLCLRSRCVYREGRWVWETVLSFWMEDTPLSQTKHTVQAPHGGGYL